jgi:hypothetical protein
MQNKKKGKVKRREFCVEYCGHKKQEAEKNKSLTRW